MSRVEAELVGPNRSTLKSTDEVDAEVAGPFETHTADVELDGAVLCTSTPRSQVGAESMRPTSKTADQADAEVTGRSRTHAVDVEVGGATGASRHQTSKCSRRRNSIGTVDIRAAGACSHQKKGN